MTCDLCAKNCDDTGKAFCQECGAGCCEDCMCMTDEGDFCTVCQTQKDCENNLDK